MNIITVLATLVLLSPPLAYGLWVIYRELSNPLHREGKSPSIPSSPLKALEFHPIKRRSAKGKSLVHQLENYASLISFRNYLIIFALILLLFIWIFTALSSTRGFSIINLIKGPAIIFVFIAITALVVLQSRQKRKSAEKIAALEREFPQIVEMFTVIVTAGESAAKAFTRIAAISHSPLGAHIKVLVAKLESGLHFTAALDEFAIETGSPLIKRFTNTLILGIERGTPLNSILSNQVYEARASEKISLIKKAGRAEIGLMIPVVFLILPISILFALWPLFAQLGKMAM